MKVKYSISLDEHLVEQVDKLAESHDLSRSYIVNKFVEQGLDRLLNGSGLLTINDGQQEKQSMSPFAAPA